MKNIYLNEKIGTILISILFLIIFLLFGFIGYKYIIKKPRIEDGQIIREYSEGSSTKIDVTKYSDGKEIVPLDQYYYGYKVYGHINIPKTGVDLPILEDLTVDGMKLAPCKVMADADLNRLGNNFIEGHNYNDGKQFSKNNDLVEGDEIYITSMEGIMKKYVISEKFITDENDVSYLQRQLGDTPEITIQTCTNDGKRRIIIIAKMESKQEDSQEDSNEEYYEEN